MITPDLRDVLNARPNQTQFNVLLDPTPMGEEQVKAFLEQSNKGYSRAQAGEQTVYQTTLTREEIQQASGVAAIQKVDYAPSFQLLGAAPRDAPQATQSTVSTVDTTDMLNVTAAWEAVGKGDGASVGIVDSPVDATHPAIKSNIVAQEGPDGKGEHGTWVAGCIAATEMSVNGTAIRGVAPNVDLYTHGVLKNGAASTGDIIDAIGLCIDQGVDVINMSFGGQHSGPLQSVISEVRANDIIPVVAAGNTGPATASVACPAHHSDAVAVAATDSNRNTSLFSSRGPGWNGEPKPDVAAPGGDAEVSQGNISATEAVVSTAPDNSTGGLLGTSMACPHIAGMIALGAGVDE